MKFPLLTAALTGLSLLLNGCVATEPQVTSAPAASIDLPDAKRFTTGSPLPALRPNAEMVQDFLDLAFELESGRPLPVLSRFEGPISVRVLGRVPSGAEADLARVLARLRAEAGINIQRVSGQDASITIEFIGGGEMQRLVPQAACFVSPRTADWDHYRRNYRSNRTDWTTLQTREQMAIFIPDDVSPQEVRDCLHEELAQTLGPVNDLFRLPDSVFNDDNFHAVLTGFDMLILKVFYAPELRSGMTREEVAAKLPALFARYNPAGNRAAGRSETPQSWSRAISGALDGRNGVTTRLANARQATAMAKSQGWSDHRAGLSYYLLGRAALSQNGNEAIQAFLAADTVFRSRPETRIQAANVAMQLAAFAFSAGRPDQAIEMINANLQTVVDSENAALLSLMLMLKAEALEAEGRASEARAVRLDSLGWARYGFGSAREVQDRLQEIAALAPKAQG